MRLYVFVLLSLVLMLQSGVKAVAQARGDVTVMADSSLTVPLTLIARNYAKEHGVQVATVFGSSKHHIKAIEAGDDANVFISAKPSWVKELQTKGLTDAYSRITVAGNQLSWVTARSRQHPIKLKSGISGASFVDEYGDSLCSFGDPEYLAEGTYGLETLNSLSLMGEMEPCFSFLQEHSDMLRSITRYKGYGLVFSSETRIFPGIKEVNQVPADAHSPIHYQAVVVAGEDMPAGREFLSYLLSGAAKNIFREFRFSVPDAS